MNLDANPSSSGRVEPRLMTPRRRWLALLEGAQADRVPTDYQATIEVTRRLLRDLNCADENALWQRLGVDKRQFVEPKWHSPRREGQGTGEREVSTTDRQGCLPHLSSDLEADPWGVRYRQVNYGPGEYKEPVFHPLATAKSVADIHGHQWPRPDDYDYTGVSRAVQSADPDYPIHAGCFEPFLLYGYLRGLDQSFEDLALHPDIADAILGHLFDFYHEHHRRIFEAGQGRIDLTWVAEDLGAQTGPLMSLAMYRRFLRPNQVKMADLARRHGIHVMYHTDGAARVFLPDLIDHVGIEILNPIQWRCRGMDRDGLVRDFGRYIIFHGSIDNQQTLAFGTVADVVNEVRDSIRIYQNARWICAPCHNLQPITPTANIVAMYEAIHEA
ncbi:MAG: uroporphyrinogen decarboxylase family protein [Candidatus Omnitrophica bacterium]|nr:uroporphyrinogen decarboxylase family protein [Candidatus Omnitrophota bacterium]